MIAPQHQLSPAEEDSIMDGVYDRGDRVVKVLILLNTLIALGLAGFNDTWTVTLIVGAAAAGLFFLSVAFVPRHWTTRCVGAICLQVFVALHIYQMHGLAEVHYLFFTACTVMLVYQDWKCVWPGALLFMGQHFLAALLQNTGVGLPFFEDASVSFSTLFLHLGIALAHVAVCSCLAQLLRQQTLKTASHYFRLPEEPSPLLTPITDVRQSDPPRAKAAPAPHFSMRQHLAETRLEAPRILLVEDNVTNQRLAEGLLKKLGCDVTLANDGIQAVGAAALRAFDLIIMDCQMPRLDGLQATIQIRSRAGPCQHIPIIAFTANAMAGDRQRCLNVGMNDYLAKPFRKDDLCQMLERWLSLKSQQPEHFIPNRQPESAQPLVQP